LNPEVKVTRRLRAQAGVAFDCGEAHGQDWESEALAKLDLLEDKAAAEASHPQNQPEDRIRRESKGFEAGRGFNRCD
jgi:hypothetical protein